MSYNIIVFIVLLGLQAAAIRYIVKGRNAHMRALLILMVMAIVTISFYVGAWLSPVRGTEYAYSLVPFYWVAGVNFWAFVIYGTALVVRYRLCGSASTPSAG